MRASLVFVAVAVAGCVPQADDCRDIAIRGERVLPTPAQLADPPPRTPPDAAAVARAIDTAARTASSSSAGSPTGPRSARSRSA